MTIAHFNSEDEDMNMSYLTDSSNNLTKLEKEKTPYEKFKLVYDALRNHKKIKFKHKRNFIYDDDNKSSPIVCIFTNPQFNRTFAILEDKAVVDYKFEFTDFGYNDFEIYDDTEEDFKEMTIEEIQNQLGFKIKIVG